MQAYEPRRDADGLELFHLSRLPGIHVGRLLEIGSGVGRLTWKIGSLAERLVALDTDIVRLGQSQLDRPPALRQRVHFTLSEAQHLPFQTRSFDSVLYSWSL
jgi:ubiquinone/menaquinone biosynthesis C-methylase UbiE